MKKLMIANAAAALLLGVSTSAFAAATADCQAMFQKADITKDGALQADEAKGFIEAMNKAQIQPKNMAMIMQEEFMTACQKDAFANIDPATIGPAQPRTTESTTGQAATDQTATTQPTTTGSTTGQAATDQTAATQPTTTESTTGQAATDLTAATQPTTTESTSGQAATDQTAATQPTTTESTTGQAATDQTATAQPTTTESTTGQAATDQTAATQP